MRNQPEEEPTPDNFTIDDEGDKFVFEVLCNEDIEIFEKLVEDLGIQNAYQAFFNGAFRPFPDEEPFPECWERFLKQLQGPYRDTLIKMYRIRNNLDVS